MASIIRIKRSETSGNPATLAAGELAYSALTFDGSNGGDRLYVGIGTETNGNAANHYVIGGKYFTDLLDHTRGTLTADSALIVDSNSKLDNLKVDNIDLNGNTISTLDSNGDLTLAPNGNGSVIIDGTNTSGNSFFVVNDGTNDRFTVDSFSGETTITTPSLSAATSVIGIDTTWNNSGATFYGIEIDVTNTASASTSDFVNFKLGGTEKFSVDLNGNVSVDGSLIVGGNVDLSDIVIADNTVDAFRVREGNNEYISINTTNGSETLILGEAGNTVVFNDLSVHGTSITTNQTTFNVFNTTATTVNAFGAATNLDIGASTGTTSINNDLDVDGDLNVDGGDLTTNQTTFNAINTNATTVNAFGAATAITIGATTGTTTIRNNVDISGDLDVDGGDITSTQSTFNLLNAGVSTLNFGGAADTINIGSATSTATFGHDVVVVGDLTVQGSITTVESNTLEIDDPLIKLGAGNPGDSKSIGFYGEYVDSSSVPVTRKTGLFRNHVDKEYYLFEDLDADITTTNVISTSGLALATFNAYDINAANNIVATGDITGDTINATLFVGEIDGGTY